MKVLYLDHCESDFGATFLYLGLCNVLGADSVIDFPPKVSYHGEVDLRPCSEIRPGGAQNELGICSPYEWFPAQPATNYTFEQVLDESETFDFVACTTRYMAVNAAKHLIALEKLPPLFLLDHEDSDLFPHELVTKLQPRASFKREEAKNVSADELLPLPFSAPFSILTNYLPDVDMTKQTDVFASFGETEDFRMEILSRLRSMADINFLGGSCGEIENFRLGHREYLAATAQSRIAINAKGFGWDTVRFWEIPMFETLMLSQRSPIRIPNPFIEGEHCSYFDTVDELEEKIRYFLSHEEEASRIAVAGHEHLKKFHTNAARAQYFLDVVQRFL